MKLINQPVCQFALFKLANELNHCQSKEESERILLKDENAVLAYSKDNCLNFKTKCLYHFVRSRIAFFQIDFSWFQKETLALINLWLDNEAKSSPLIGQISSQEMLQILIFRAENTPTCFPQLFLESRVRTDGSISSLNKTLLHQLVEDKKIFLNLR